MTIKEWLKQNANIKFTKVNDKFIFTDGKSKVTIKKDGLQYNVKWDGEQVATTNIQLDAIEILNMAFKKN